MVEQPSQRERVLMHLEQESITAMDAVKLYGIYRLAPIIFNLKKEGFNIITSMHYTEGRKRYAEYCLHSH